MKIKLYVQELLRELVSLLGGPQDVGRNYVCYNNELVNLEGCPVHIVGNFLCSSNKLSSLEYLPNSIGGNFYCGFNELLDDYFKGLPYAQVKLYLDNKSLESLLLLLSDATVLSNKISVGKKI